MSAYATKSCFNCACESYGYFSRTFNKVGNI